MVPFIQWTLFRKKSHQYFTQQEILWATITTDLSKSWLVQYWYNSGLNVPWIAIHSLLGFKIYSAVIIRVNGHSNKLLRQEAKGFSDSWSENKREAEEEAEGSWHSDLWETGTIGKTLGLLIFGGNEKNKAWGRLSSWWPHLCGQLWQAHALFLPSILSGFLLLSAL